MIKRYAHPEITEIWSDERKTALWQIVEVTVINTNAAQGIIPEEAARVISEALRCAPPCDIEWWKEREKILGHDLNAWLEERRRHLPEKLRHYFHKKMTSYDTEEPAFALMLRESGAIITDLLMKLGDALQKRALAHRFIPMMARTHGQDAELQSLGRRFLTWFADVRTADKLCETAQEAATTKSKMSGAIGNYGGLTHGTERRALTALILEPYYGATQIMPRIIHSAYASALADLATVLEKIAWDIRLGARSGRPLWHEPFSKKQKGSSAMPHKKNTLVTERVSGMARLARGYASVIRENILTWEERAIEQSSAERVVWPDLFHAVAQALKDLTRVVTGLVIYPDNMLREIRDSRGTYASNAAKEFLAERGAEFGIGAEDAYRIVQLASFNAFAPNEESSRCRSAGFTSPEEGESLLSGVSCEERRSAHLNEIAAAALYSNPELDATSETIAEWNRKLGLLLSPGSNPKTFVDWSELFRISGVFVQEYELFREVFGA